MNPINVLAIMEHPDVLGSMATILERNGCHVFSPTGVQEGRVKLTCEAAPNVVIVDCDLLGIDLAELGAEVDRRFTGVPIISIGRTAGMLGAVRHFPTPIRLVGEMLPAILSLVALR